MGKGETDILRPWVVEALTYYGGAATLIDISKHVWENHSEDLEKSGDLFYRWQYVLRWAGTTLRHEGTILPAEDSERGVWVLNPSR
tara:strand:- start:249 stop:506 length:258 start_codon:yes stop_codon:yes gene_type:complete